MTRGRGPRISGRRVRAIVAKEVREYRHTGSIVSAMAIFPLAFILTPVIQVFVLPSSSAHIIRHEQTLLYLLAIPALVPSTLASYSVVGERQQGTLEPLLCSPIRREEFLLGKAIAAFFPSLIISYLVYGVFVAITELFAAPGIAPALIRGPVLLVQILFTPLLAAWSIWVGILISARMNDIRSAQQLSAVASLPSVAVTSLMAYNVIHPSVKVAFGCGIGLFVLDRVGWRVVSAAFDRERLITGTR